MARNKVYYVMISLYDMILSYSAEGGGVRETVCGLYLPDSLL